MKTIIVKIFSRIRIRAIAAMLFNLICMISGKAVRIRWDASSFVLPNNFRYIWPGRSFAYIDGTEGRAGRLEEDYLLRHVDFQDGDRVLDCGANIGELMLCLAERSKNIRYVAFEPSPREFELLKKNAEIFDEQDVELHPVALSDKEGDTSFFIKSETADSSIFPIENPEATVTVPTELLAKYLDEGAKFLKLEAEGAEPEVLKGAGDAIRRVEYIACDCGPERGLSQNHTIAECVNLLLEKDFELIDVCLSRFVFLFKNKCPTTQL